MVRGARGGDLELSRRAAGHLLWAGEGPLFDADEVTVEVEGRAPAGVVLVREEGTWTSSELGARRLWAAWVAPGGERVAVGAGGAVALDGAAGLELVEVGVEADLTAVHGTDAAELWVVGSGGAILRMAGGQWELEEGGTAERLEAILAHDGDVFAAGAGGTVLRRDGSGRWRAEETGTSADLYGLAAGPSGEVLAVGSGGTLLRRVAGSWETEPTGTSAELRAVAATEDGTIVAVGRGGFAVGVDGRGPRAEVTGTTRDLHAVAADGALVLAAGIGGTVLAREPGGRWSALEVGVGSDLHAVAVGPWGDALFVGFSGTFPSFTATARVPEGLGDPSLTASESGGAVVEWGGSGGGYVDITLRAGVDDDPSRTNRLRCIVRDDGCHGIGQDAIGWLVSGTTGDLEVRVERHEMQFAVVDGQSAVAFGLVRAHGFSVEL